MTESEQQTLEYLAEGMHHLARAIDALVEEIREERERADDGHSDSSTGAS